MEANHIPVMLDEVISCLDPVPGGRYVDGTAGAGGHTGALLERVGSQGTVLALDRDPEAVSYLEKKFSEAGPNLLVRRANFSDVGRVTAELGWGEVDGMVLDLGLSSRQLEASGRGFSFNREEPLDMRMNPNEGPTAFDLVNRLPEKELADLIYNLGGERGSRRAARAIVAARGRRPIETSLELAEIVRKALWRPGRRPKIDSATRTFQALRLAVNRELNHLEVFLAQAPRLVKVGGIVVVISFHSLEDRRVKNAWRKGGEAMARKEGEPFLEAVNKKPLTPSPQESAANPRSRSAKLRAGRRIF